MKDRNIMVITGLALFAMFFGTGNIIFPLQLGVISGQNLLFSLSGFMISGIGIPLLGLYALSLSGGDYSRFFSFLGKKLSFLTITFIVLVIGLFVGSPRTAIVTHGTFSAFLPGIFKSPFLFNAFYYATVFFLIQKGDRLVTLIGRYISPVKITSLVCLIICAVIYSTSNTQTVLSGEQLFGKGFTMGYGTMDLLGAFFFGTTVYQNLRSKSSKYHLNGKKDYHRVMVKACLLGGVLTMICYTGLMLATYRHSSALASVATENLISSLSMLVFGKFGTIFVCFLVFIASIATACALTEVTTYYVHVVLLKEKLGRQLCLIMSLSVMYTMSILGFKVVMDIALPILSVLYPALIGYCFYIIYKYKFVGRKKVMTKMPMGVVVSSG